MSDAPPPRRSRRPANEPRAPEAGRLFQEDLLDEPFWMLVACSLVNLTTWTAARPSLDWLRARYVVPRVLAAADPADLHDAMRPLGLWRRRSISLVRLAQAWVLRPPHTAQEVLKLPGCGRYAADSWAIFIEGLAPDVLPTDGKLQWYLQELQHGRIRARRRLQP